MNDRQIAGRLRDVRRMTDYDEVGIQDLVECVQELHERLMKIEERHNDRVEAVGDADSGYRWDDVMDTADQLFENLHEKGFSSQDTAHIGLRLMHLGNFAWILEGKKYVEGKGQ